MRGRANSKQNGDRKTIPLPMCVEGQPPLEEERRAAPTSAAGRTCEGNPEGEYPGQSIIK